MLANRASAARSKENREKKIRDMELRVETLENTQASLFGTMTLLEVRHIYHNINHLLVMSKFLL